MTLADRIVSFFLTAPAGADGEAPARVAPPRTATRAAATVAVLGEDAGPTAGAIAAALARDGAGVALVCLYRAPDDEPSAALRPPPVPAASKLAARLSARGHDAVASGRAVLLALPVDDAAAAAEAGRASAAADVPTVFALAGARTPALDRLLAHVDAVVLAPRGDVAAALTAAAEPALAAELRVPVLTGDPAPDRRSRRALAARMLEVLR